jgi:hypothetical protein
VTICFIREMNPLSSRSDLCRRQKRRQPPTIISTTPHMRVVSCRVVSCRVVSCRVVSCRVVSCRVVSCRVVGSVVGRGEGNAPLLCAGEVEFELFVVTRRSE